MNVLYNKILNLKYLPRILKILIIIGINWTFQSLLYMEKTDKLFKLLLDLVLFLIFFIVFKQFLNILSTIIVAITLAHSFNWIFNGHIFALLKTFGIVKTKYSSFLTYMEKLKERGSKEKSIKCIATFGSISREELKETSDIDIRVVKDKGFVNGIRSSVFVMLERSKSVFNGFPLDIYLLEDEKSMHKLKERPIFLVKDGMKCE